MPRYSCPARPLARSLLGTPLSRLPCRGTSGRRASAGCSEAPERNQRAEALLQVRRGGHGKSGCLVHTPTCRHELPGERLVASATDVHG